MAESPAAAPQPESSLAGSASPSGEFPQEVDLEAALEKLTAEQLKKFEFIINEDGSVTFIDFPAELMDLAYALNPDDPLVCERRAQATPAAAAPAEPAE